MLLHGIILGFQLSFLLDSNPNRSFIYNKPIWNCKTTVLRPRWGKTFLIADICKLLLNENKSVLVTALTNRGIDGIGGERPFETFYLKGRIFKTKVSVDENFANCPELVNTKSDIRNTRLPYSINFLFQMAKLPK